jgi:uncharacterized protein
VDFDFLALARSVEDSQSGATSRLHGPDHWRKVALVGLTLADASPECDRDLLLLFALLHDSQRQNENEDPAHGERAAAFATTLNLPLSPQALATLVFALHHHDTGQLSDDPTIAVCWDADRLNLWRVGIQPDPELLSTPQARLRERIIWAGRLQKQHFEWEYVLTHLVPIDASLPNLP